MKPKFIDKIAMQEQWGLLGEMVQYNSIKLRDNKLVQRNGVAEWQQCRMLMVMLIIEKRSDYYRSDVKLAWDSCELKVGLSHMRITFTDPLLLSYHHLDLNIIFTYHTNLFFTFWIVSSFFSFI